MQNFDYTGLGVCTQEDAFGAYDDPEDEFGATSYQDYEQRSPLKTAEREYEYPQAQSPERELFGEKFSDSKKVTVKLIKEKKYELSKVQAELDILLEKLLEYD